MANVHETYRRLGNEEPPLEAQNATQAQSHLTQVPTPYIPRAVNKSREKHKNKLFGLGIAECILGGLSIILSIATLSSVNGRDVSRHDWFGLTLIFTYISQGIWGGVFIAVTGILGITAKRNPTVSIYKANMVLSILTAVFAAIAIVISGFATIFSLGQVNGIFIVHILIALLLFAGFVIAIVHSAFCCAGVCGKRYSHPGTVVYMPQLSQTQQIGGLPNMQYVMPASAMVQHQNYVAAGSPATYQSVPVVAPTTPG